MVYYRKYRPQTIADLDNAALRDRLTSLLANPEHVPHAFLFTGPKGTGKTSTARIIAKIVNCEENLYAGKGKNIEPCNTCSECVSITNGSSMDVLEIDGASNRGIDEIRDLREKVRLSPVSARKKVYIIDEVHMLTTEAFNALLKTIEEPPAHVLFIFCTTEPHKVPDTIISRCVHVAITKGSKEEVVGSLQKVVEAEKLSIDQEVLEEIARITDGGFRDAKKILEELASAAEGKTITLDLLHTLHHSGTGLVFAQEFMNTICVQDGEKAISLIENAAAENMDMGYILDTLLDLLHTQLLLHYGIGEGEMMEMSEEFIAYAVDVFSRAKGQMKYASVSQLPLELAIIELIPGDEKESEEEKEPASSVKVQSGKPNLTMMMKKQQHITFQQRINPPKPPVPVKKVSSEKSPQISVNHDITFMDNLIQKVKAVNNSLSGVLRGITLSDKTDDSLTFTTRFSFHKERLEESANYAIMEKAIREIMGKQMKFNIQLVK